MEENQSNSAIYPYTKTHCFRDALIDLQGKELICIPDEVIMKIALHVKKSGIDVNTLNDYNMWEILRGLGLRMYEDHATYIFRRMGRTNNVPELSQEETDMCIRLFEQIQKSGKMYNIRKCAKSIINDVINMRNQHHVPEQVQEK